MPEIRLPIRVVIPQDQDYQRDTGGGGPRKEFAPVTRALRDSLSGQVEQVASYFQPAFSQGSLPAVARVVLRSEALAKSHRPAALFNRTTCPIIGLQDFGELLVSVTPLKLAHLQHRIQNNDSKLNDANLSTIERIEPFKPEDALGGVDATWMRERLAARPVVKFRLFQHDDPTETDKLIKGFYARVRSLRLPEPEQVRYGGDTMIFKISEANYEAAAELARFVGAQSVSPFPRYRTVRTEAVVLRRASSSDLSPPNPREDYPIVGVIDTGVNPTDPLLSPWVVAREVFVPDGSRDYSHGSFVAGLIAGGYLLNHQDPRFPRSQAKIVDVTALPRDGDSLTEDDLLAIIEEVVPKYPDVRVWNLSLGLAEPPCCNSAFSDFGTALDRIQDEYDVMFVVAAGNYAQAPFRGWPPENLGEIDRICPPADSVRSVVVGSIAHKHSSNSRVRSEEPSPFSKRGPGAAFLPKPELSHYGGNCSRTGDYAQTGILSVDGALNLAENIGTSFAAPLVSAILANVCHGFQQVPSRVLCKALAVHSAVLGGQGVEAQTLRYRGFGIPSDVQGVFTCSPSSATLIFEPEVLPGLQFVKDGFPIPDCLRDNNGKVRGELIITLVYDPPLEDRYGSEYCRRNVSASLGTYDPGKDGKPAHQKQVPESPKDISKLYEKHLIEHGFKWSPVKVYQRDITRGVTGENWRLVVEGQDRSGFMSDEPTPTALIITIRDHDPHSTKPVYNEVVAKMTARGWITQDIPITNRVRTRFIS